MQCVQVATLVGLSQLLAHARQTIQMLVRAPMELQPQETVALQMAQQSAQVVTPVGSSIQVVLARPMCAFATMGLQPQDQIASSTTLSTVKAVARDSL
jgi:hypothetical protein